MFSIFHKNFTNNNDLNVNFDQTIVLFHKFGKTVNVGKNVSVVVMGVALLGSSVLEKLHW